MKIFRDLPGYSAWDRAESALDSFSAWSVQKKTHIIVVNAVLLATFFGIHFFARVE
jgi:hypothetical protein